MIPARMNLETRENEIDLRQAYDEQYYAESYGGPVPYERNDYWLKYFHAIADQIVRSLQPGRVLDAGCAKGFLVEALWERGIAAYGIDISEYAISQVRRDMQAYCRCASLTEPIAGEYDLVTCFEVLEHIPETQVRQVLRNLTSVSDRILFSSTPTEMDTPTHVNVRPIISWLWLFAEFAFAPVLGFDASFIAPHAILLQRVAQVPTRDVLVLFADLIRYKLTLTDRHNRIAHLDNETGRLRQEIGQLSQQNAGLREQQEQARAQSQRDAEEAAQLRRQVAAVQAQLRQKSGEAENLEHQLSDCQLLLERKSGEAENLQRQLSQSLARLELKSSESENLQRQLNESLAQLQHRSGGVEDLERQLNQSLAQLQQQSGERDALREQLEEERRRYQAAEALAANELAQVNTELRRVSRQCTDLACALDSATERLAVRQGALESGIASVARQNYEILHSRIWRTLRTLGSLLLGLYALLTWRPRRKRQAHAYAPAAGNGQATSTESFDLVCDEPQADPESPRTGRIPVRGWALAESGVERIEVELASARSVTRTGVVRPDVARSYPPASAARTCGYMTEIDSQGVAKGRHSLFVTAVSRAGQVRRLEIPVYIDHDSGFSSDYDRWIREFETRNAELIDRRIQAFAYSPLISVVMPVYRTPPRILQLAVDSVVAQSYPNWELCIADDASGSAEIERLLRDYAQQDQRIRYRLLQGNGGIAAASNAALELAHGEFITLLDHDDELTQDALYHVADALNRRQDLDLIYSDEDKIDEHGKRYDPFFKPDWSPDLLLSENYIAHLLVARRSLVMEAGAFRRGFDGSQDHDLILRLVEKSDRIEHIPKILYHWRASPTSTAALSTQKSYAAEAAQRAIEGHLERRGVTAKVVPGSNTNGRWRVRYALDAEPAVSIIIAAGGKTGILSSNLESLLGKTEYRNFEVVVIDNSKKNGIEKLVRGWPDPARPLRYIDWRDQPFNYSAINNAAARQCDSPLLLFLNDDTSVIAPGWLTAMVEMAVRPEVGAVGAKLLYPDGRIQHAGVVMGIFGNCGHAFKSLASETSHYFDFPDVIRNVSAVTGACLMTRAEVFREAGGFDETNFAVAFNDIDLCLKIREKGYRVIYTPYALLYHHEAFSKTAKDLVPDSKEVHAMRSKWRQVIEADPYYNPNLTRSTEDYSLARKADAARILVPEVTTPQ